MAGDDVEIAGLTGVVITYGVASELVKALDVLEALAFARGSRTPARWRDLRRELAYQSLTRDETHADASTRVGISDLPHADDALIDTSAAASELGLTEDAVRWHCRRGRFASVAIRRAGRWWIPEEDVHAEQAARQRV